MEPSEKPGTPLQDLESVEHIFKKYYAFVCNTIYPFLKDRNKTEDVAQEIFAELWVKRDQIMIHTSIGAYLRKMAATRALNFIRDNKKYTWDELENPEENTAFATVPPDALMAMEGSELGQKIDRAIQKLPEKCRIVFLMSRLEEMSYQEIANHLGISIKTVENQIGKALRLLRLEISGHRG